MFILHADSGINGKPVSEHNFLKTYVSQMQCKFPVSSTGNGLFIFLWNEELALAPNFWYFQLPYTGFTQVRRPSQSSLLDT